MKKINNDTKFFRIYLALTSCKLSLRHSTILNGWKIKCQMKFSIDNYKIMNMWVKK